MNDIQKAMAAVAAATKLLAEATDQLTKLTQVQPAPVQKIQEQKDFVLYHQSRGYLMSHPIDGDWWTTKVSRARRFLRYSTVETSQQTWMGSRILIWHSGLQDLVKAPAPDPVKAPVTSYVAAKPMEISDSKYCTVPPKRFRKCRGTNCRAEADVEKETVMFVDLEKGVVLWGYDYKSTSYCKFGNNVVLAEGVSVDFSLLEDAAFIRSPLYPRYAMIVKADRVLKDLFNKGYVAARVDAPDRYNHFHNLRHFHVEYQGQVHEFKVNDRDGRTVCNLLSR